MINVVYSSNDTANVGCAFFATNTIILGLARYKLTNSFIFNYNLSVAKLNSTQVTLTLANQDTNGSSINQVFASMLYFGQISCPTT